MVGWTVFPLGNVAVGAASVSTACAPGLETYNEAPHSMTRSAPMSTNSEFARICERSARAGAAVLQSWKGRFNVREKGPSDLVTEADEASQEAVKRTILEAFPDHDVLGEEDQTTRKRTSTYRWIVDPLDGTTNYVHGVPHYAVSIALEHNGQLLTGAVYDPS